MQSRKQRAAWALQASVAFLTLLAPFSASALDAKKSTQVTSATFSAFAYGTPSGEDNEVFVNIAQCRDAVRLDAPVTIRFDTTFDISVANMLSGSFYFEGAYTFGYDRGQGNSPACVTNEDACVELDDARVTRDMKGATVTVPFRTITGFTSESDCEATGFDRDYFVRLQLYNGVTPDEADVKLSLDLTRPSEPEDFDATVTERGVRLRWTPSSANAGDVNRYQIVYSSRELELPAYPDELSGVGSVFVLSNPNNVASTAASFEANTIIWLGVAAVDEAGNPSYAIGPKSFEVIDTIDFWEAYKNSGGSEPGGHCSAAPQGAPGGSGALLWLGTSALLGLHIRRRARLTTQPQTEESP